MATQNICNFNKFGFCKFRDRCRKQHVNDKCENSSCDISVYCACLDTQEDADVTVNTNGVNMVNGAGLNMWKM